MTRRHPTAALAVAPLALAALLAAAPARAERPVEQRVAARAHGEVEIQVLAGEVEIAGWDEPEVEVKGTLGAGVEELQLRFDGYRVVVLAALDPTPSGPQHDVAARLTIRVPAGSAVTFRGGPASVAVAGVAGRLELQTIEGAVAVAGQGADDVSSETVISEVVATTVSGDLELTAAARVAHLKTVTGRVTVAGDVEDLTVETVSGDADVTGRIALEGRLSTVSGRIAVTGEIDRAARLRLFVHEGTAEVALPADAPLELALRTTAGTLASDFGAPSADGRELRFTAGAEAPRTRIEGESLRGEIRIRRAP